MDIKTLNQHLFNQLERLDGDLNEDAIEKESKRAKAINEVAQTIVATARLSLEAEQFKHQVTGALTVSLPMMKVK